MHEVRQRHRALLGSEMNVVRHEAIRVEPESEPFPISGDSLEVIFAIRIVAEDLAPLVSAGDQMMEASWRLESRRSGHPTRIVASGRPSEVDARCRVQ
jgi:hypothetical protein